MNVRTSHVSPTFRLSANQSAICRIRAAGTRTRRAARLNTARMNVHSKIMTPMPIARQRGMLGDPAAERAVGPLLVEGEQQQPAANVGRAAPREPRRRAS